VPWHSRTFLGDTDDKMAANFPVGSFAKANNLPVDSFAKANNFPVDSFAKANKMRYQYVAFFYGATLFGAKLCTLSH
jgi:hypothetical protein